MTIIHYKQKVLDLCLTNSNPRDRHIKQVTAPHVQVKRLLRDMVSDKLITITYTNYGGTVKRNITCITQDIISHIHI